MAQPVLQPTRDVDVLYVLGDHASAAQERSRWQGSSGRQRIDPPSPQTYMVADPRAGTMSVVNDQARQVVRVPTAVAGPAATAGYTRVGAATIAGFACTDWQVAADQRLCLTDDGVLLRMVAGGVTRAQAVRVTYGPLDAGLFQVPPMYQQLSGQARR